MHILFDPTTSLYLVQPYILLNSYSLKLGFPEAIDAEDNKARMRGLEIGNGSRRG